MPVLSSVARRLYEERPFEGLTVGACLHVTAETANLLVALRDGGARVVACASNPLSTQDDVAASLLLDEAMSIYAVRGENLERYYHHLDAVAATTPQLTLDDGCDLVSRLHQQGEPSLAEAVGGTEETASGVLRLRAMERAGVLAYPIVAVGDCATNRLADNRHGTGQSTLDGLIRATNVLLAGRRLVVAGYGQCGKGIAARARGLGALVTVTEIDPLRALEAVMDGFQVDPMTVAARYGEIFVTATGSRDVIGAEHFALMGDGAILLNAGHFDIEIDVVTLGALAGGRRRAVRPAVEELEVRSEGGDTKRLLLVSEGRVVNLSAAEGHPSSVMDLSFAIQALCAEWLVGHRGELEPRVYDVPGEIDTEVARLKLASMGIELDVLDDAQQAYLESWTVGT